MKVIKKNLPKGVKKQFGKVKGVKVKFVANDKHKKAGSRTMGVCRSFTSGVKADLKSILHARAGPDFPALCLQPLQTGRSRDFEEPPGTQWPRHTRGS